MILVGGTIVGLIFSWRVALVGLACVPITSERLLLVQSPTTTDSRLAVSIGMIQFKVVALKVSLGAVSPLLVLTSMFSGRKGAFRDVQRMARELTREIRAKQRTRKRHSKHARARLPFEQWQV